MFGQEAYNNQCLEDYDVIDMHHRDTPIKGKLIDAVKAHEGESFLEDIKYARMIGSLQFLV